MKKKMILLVMVLIATIVMAGCMQMVVDINIHEDMSADISTRVGIATEYYDMVGGDEAFGEMDNMEADGFKSQPYEADGFKGIEISGSVSDITKPNEALSTVSSDTFITVEEKNGKTYVTMDLPMSDLNESFEGGTGGSLEEFAQYGNPDMRIVVTFPYDVTEHNASSVSGKTLTWNLLEVKDGSLHAVVEVPKKGGSLVKGLILAVVVLAIIAITIIVLSKMNKNKKKAASTATFEPNKESTFEANQESTYEANKAPSFDVNNVESAVNDSVEKAEETAADTVKEAENTVADSVEEVETTAYTAEEVEKAVADVLNGTDDDGGVL